MTTPPATSWHAWVLGRLIASIHLARGDYMLYSGPVPCSRHRSLREAQAVAQRDWETLIRSSLH